MADVAATLAAWSSTDASNTPSGGTTVGTGWDDNLRAIQGVIVRGLSNKGADIASAGTCDIGAIEGLAHDITGVVTITNLGTVRAGIWKILQFDSALTLTHNGTSLVLPGAANITTATGDVAIFISEGSGNWRCVSYVPAAVTGTGAIVKATSPTLVTPALGTPASGVLTNCTGTATGLTAGNVTTNANLTGHVTSTGNAAVLGSFTLAQLSTAVSDANVGITLATEQATTSGTSIDFTGIPAGVKRITVMLEGVSMDGTSPLLLQIGDSGGIEITGYYSLAHFVVNAGSTQGAQSSAGFIITAANSVSSLQTGAITLSLKDAANHTWVAAGVLCDEASNTNTMAAGRKASLDSALTQVRLTTVNGSDTFDAGSVNISYES